ncbi:MAG: hypothetical protein ACTSU6_06695, partial [Candidatus Njordarchaeales archaeon]
RAFKILLTSGSIISDTALDHDRKILAACGRIFRSEQMGQTFLYLCRHGAATGWLLQVQLGFSETGAHRVLKKLKALGIVEPILKVPQRRMRRSGPMPTIWGLLGCSDEEVARAVTLHYRTLSPKYRAAEKVAQTILDEFRLDQSLEVRYTDIMHRVKTMKIPYSSPDIADLAAQYLHERGIKVWR